MSQDTLIYLDNAATLYPKPDEVYEYMISFYRQFGVNPGRSGYDLCIEAGQVVERTRRQLTGFFNGTDWTRLVFGYNSTDALNLALFGLLQQGDHAVSTTLEHNSVLRPLWHLSQRNGVEVDYVPFDAAGFVSPDDIASRFKPNTKVVAINHASNVIGTVQPIAEIGRRCRERGITMVVDSSQTAGKIPIDVQAMNIGVLCFTGHKSLLGPTGIGGMYVSEGVEIRHTRAGGTGVKSAVREHLDEYPYRMEDGTGNTIGIAGLNAGVRWVEAKGVEAIDRHEMALTRKLSDGLRAIDGVTLYCQEDLENHIGVIAFNLAGLEAGDVGTMLDVDHNIACRTGLHCAPLVHVGLGTEPIKGAVRFGVGPFNTEADIDHAIGAVAEVAKVGSKRIAKR